MHISNGFVIVCNIQIVIWMLKIYYFKFEYGDYLMAKLNLVYK